MRLIKPERFTPSGPEVNLPHDALIGTVKSTSVRFFTANLGNNRLTPIIVVAIRGTVPIRDWAVNLNHDDETESTTFLVLFPSSTPSYHLVLQLNIGYL